MDEHTASGLTTKAFAAKKNVNPRTLAWWRSRLKRLDHDAKQLPVPQSAFAEVVVAKSTVVVALERVHLERAAHRVTVARASVMV